MHVILIGLRGCGKTTAGRAAARILNRAFIDLDDRTSEIVGMSASECFVRHGEVAWREAESLALRDALAGHEPTVIALGGGTPTAPDAETMLRLAKAERGDTIAWLDASPEVLVGRIHEDGDRPPLTGLPPLEEMIEIDRRRRALFEAIADRRIEVDDHSTSTTIGAIIALATSG